MSNKLDALADLINNEREILLAAWRQKARALPSARHLDVPSLNDHVPNLLIDLVEALRSPPSAVEDSIEPEAPAEHGAQRVEDGYDIEEVIAEYNVLRGCIHNLADEHGVVLQGTPFLVLNRIFDNAIAVSVKSFAVHSALQVQRRREEYLSFVAHDLRTPLNAINLATQVLERCEHDAGITMRMVGILRRNVHQLSTLVDTVLKENKHIDTINDEQLYKRNIELWPLIEGILGDIRPLADTAGTKVINAVPDGLAAFADASVLRRVFQNLISNAIAHAPGGEVRVAANSGGKEGEITCSVSDNGIGMTREKLQSISEATANEDAHPEIQSPADTTTTPSSGLGLGLAIVKKFIEAHGGTLHAESTENEGSTFSFNLPRNPA